MYDYGNIREGEVQRDAHGNYFKRIDGKDFYLLTNRLGINYEEAQMRKKVLKKLGYLVRVLNDGVGLKKKSKDIYYVWAYDITPPERF